MTDEPLIKGVDVASYQSTAYDLTGLDFVVVKATEGTHYVNPKMPQQAARARAAGAVLGFYHFLVKSYPKEQAAYFVNKAGARAGEFLACDWETASDGSYATSEEKDTFIREVQRLAPGRRVILYCNLDYYHRDKSSFAGDGLWIADPNHASGHPGIKSAWLFDQYSTAGGIDHDVAHFPSRQALADWAAMRPAQPAPPTGGDQTMTLTAPDVWKWDGIQAPDDYADKTTNPTWAPASYVRNTYAEVRRLRVELAAVGAQCAANGEALTRALGALEALAGAVASLGPSGTPSALRSALDGATLTIHTEGQQQ